MRNPWTLPVLLGAGCAILTCPAIAADRAEGVAFFESKIRPLLIESCYECHSAEKKVKGGLHLDSRAGWQRGGDSGPALVPGKLEESLLIEAVRYRNKDFQMPPKRKLSAAQIADLEHWVKLGAPDPRSDTAAPVVATGIDVEQGRQFWAYQLPRKTAPPEVKDTAWPRTEVDRFILAALEAKGIRPVVPADRATLARRAYYDLIGLPPTPEQIDEFVNDSAPGAFARLVDGLLASPHFGERWGRHWLDVVRFGESMTLRGLVFKEAWRYRDYVIDYFNRDYPFDRFIVEQVAGDLLPTAAPDERRRQMIATTFLAMGNHNLEEQDKGQLRMDVVDEQLDTIGKAFLAQTLGCARCHDHKFDPIPTRDYYAMAGILRNTQTLIEANVSNWIDRPLPLDPEREKVMAEHEAEVEAWQAKIKRAKARATKLAKAAESRSPATSPDILPVSQLPGIVVDDTQAKPVGEWKESQFTARYIGEGYLHDLNAGKGAKSLTFLPELPHAGKYEVRLAYNPGSNRASNVPVTVFSAGGEITIAVDQRQEPPIDRRFISLGQHQFELNGQGFVIVGTEGTSGHVVADAVQFIPLEPMETLAKADAPKPASEPSSDEATRAAEELKQLERQLKQLVESGPVRPKAMSVQEEAEIGDTYVHVRGNVHNLGEPAPRGFLQVATYTTPPPIPENESGRRELGEWLSSPSNPLTARVMVNRIWHWLFGAGLVRTTDNFGTTGELPSHPELLDYLAVRFMDEGWSVKSIVREVMLSQTYQLASATEARAQEVDPENRWFWCMNRRRLEAEQIRDTILWVSGQLQSEMTGPGFQPGLSADYNFQHRDTRRSIYAPVFRNALPEIFEAFDFADPSMVTGKRNVSTVAPQALFLLNHPFMLEQAQTAARRVLAETNLDDAARLELAYRRTLGRPPTAGETALALRHLAASSAAGPSEARVEVWAQLFQALFASMDFRYLN